MDSNKRIIANTIAQYTKSIVNICLSLYSTRLILDALNISDYGIYSLVAGVVGIFGYLTNSLVVTTQRYISFYHGAGDIPHVKKIFANSVFVHFLICILFVTILLYIGDYTIGHFLNIVPERREAALIVYMVTTLMLVITIATTPFKALLTAHENIVYISIVEICDGVLKLCLALVLMFVDVDKLIFYALMMLCILIINFLAFLLYCFFKYEESRVPFRIDTIDKQCIKQITGFAGWTTFGMLAGLSQTQGTAIILNKLFGTMMNASFGIASQVNGAIRFVSTSILNAMNPQIMKAEGANDRIRMLKLAGKESKFSAALMILISMPLIFEMPDILSFWLKEVPDYSAMFSQALMVAFIVDQLSLGLHAANQATGKIKIYTICTTIPKILLIPIMWGVISMNGSLETAMCFYIGVELLVAIFRIPYMKYSAGLNIKNYINDVLKPLLPLMFFTGLACCTTTYFLHFPFRFIVTGIVSVSVSIGCIWKYTLAESERSYLKTVLLKKKTYED